ETTLTGIAWSARSMMSGASMYAACSLPLISDSLSSGQPLYFANSKSGDPLAEADAWHATGSVRLHVTGKPPTVRGLAAPRTRVAATPAQISAPVPARKRRRRTRRANRESSCMDFSSENMSVRVQAYAESHESQL